MALVAYGSSDSSDNEVDELETPTPVLVKETTASNSDAHNGLVTNSDDTEQSLFNHLPKPSTKKIVIEEEDDEFLHKKEKEPNIVKPRARITVPSLNDFKDIESTPSKPRVTSSKTSGLLSMLPQPKNSISSTNTKSFIPHVLTQKPASTVKKKTLISPAKFKTETSTKTSILDYSDESDNDDEIQNDFFSINKPIELPEDIPPEGNLSEPTDVYKNKNTAKPVDIQSYFKQNGIDDQNEHVINNESESYGNSSTSNEPESSEVVLDEEAIRQLCGSRGKRKHEEIQIIDVNQQEVLANAREMLLKGIMDDTTVRVSSSKKKGNEPTSQQKRKHQITYLAHQAKAKEAELQNQWANNRLTKRKTQSKYGF